MSIVLQVLFNKSIYTWNILAFPSFTIYIYLHINVLKVAAYFHQMTEPGLMSFTWQQIKMNGKNYQLKVLFSLKIF